MLFLDMEIGLENNPALSLFPNFSAAYTHGGFVSRSHKEGANIKANHIVLITGLQPAPLFHGFPGIFHAKRAIAKLG